MAGRHRPAVSWHHDFRDRQHGAAELHHGLAPALWHEPAGAASRHLEPRPPQTPHAAHRRLCTLRHCHCAHPQWWCETNGRIDGAAAAGCVYRGEHRAGGAEAPPGRTAGWI